MTKAPHRIKTRGEAFAAGGSEQTASSAGFPGQGPSGEGQGGGQNGIDADVIQVLGLEYGHMASGRRERRRGGA